ncbi:unnamed protein product [Caenorhabditis angaria]|uniref:NOT2/NOT3/NOT5 C-terminal domain-containing protein n=1 Tax=Caenorhabditis angaria TaxID=860376 RepID=A0A9P1MZC3_9PELO|nr:unnamed protein product [Caenorhabditis angaria]
MFLDGKNILLEVEIKNSNIFTAVRPHSTIVCAYDYEQKLKKKSRCHAHSIMVRDSTKPKTLQNSQQTKSNCRGGKFWRTRGAKSMHSTNNTRRSRKMAATAEPRRFLITNEDFPALPGTQIQEEKQEDFEDYVDWEILQNTPESSQRPDSVISLEDFLLTFDSGFSTEYSPSQKDVEENSEMSTTPKKSHSSNPNSFLRRGAQKSFSENQREVPKIQLEDDGKMSNISSRMLDDQFGIAAMLPILKVFGNDEAPPKITDERAKKRAYQMEKSIQKLSCGVDLCSLGVPIEDIEAQSYPSFSGPFGFLPLRATEKSIPELEPPEVYKMSQVPHIRTSLNKNLPEMLDLHAIFFLFYNFPGELWQVNAARELQARGWRYHIPQKIWIRRKFEENRYQEPIFGFQPEPEIRGFFEYFDSETDEIVSREMDLKSADIEKASWDDGKEDVQYKEMLKILPPEMIWGPQVGKQTMFSKLRKDFNEIPQVFMSKDFKDSMNQFLTMGCFDRAINSRSPEYRAEIYATIMSNFPNSVFPPNPNAPVFHFLLPFLFFQI